MEQKPTRTKALRRKKALPGIGANRAFTLLELLVTIVVIAILAALLLPALSRAKMVARRTECMSNFRQWGFAMLMYVDDNEGVIPRESYGRGVQRNRWQHVSDPISADVWYNALPPYLTLRKAVDYADPAERPQFYERGSLFQCPQAKFASDRLYVQFSMGMNSQLIKVGLPITVHHLCHPTDTVMFMENRLEPEPMPATGFADDSLGQPSADWRRFVGRHGRRGNLVFWDGRLEPYAGSQISSASLPPSQTIFWSPCN